MEKARRDAGLKSDLDRLREVNDVIQTGDVRAMSEALHPEVVWEHNLGGGTPEEGVYRGRESVLALFERILEPWEYLRPEPREIRALGAGAFELRGELRAKHSTSATEVVSPYLQRFQLRDGLLLKGEMVTGDDSAWQAGDIEVVRRVVEVFRRRDVEGLRAVFDEESEFRSALAGIEGGSYRGPADMERYVDDLDAVFDDWHTEDERYVDAGNGQVVFVYRIVGRGKGSGVPIDQEVAISWIVRDGRVLRGEVYLDPEEALASVE